MTLKSVTNQPKKQSCPNVLLLITSNTLGQK